MKRTASTSISIFAVSSAITALSGKPVIGLFSFALSSPGLTGRSSSRERHSRSEAARFAITACPACAGHDNNWLRHHLPLDGLAAAPDQGAFVGARHLGFFGRGPRRLLQRDRLRIGRQPIMLWPV